MTDPREKRTCPECERPRREDFYTTVGGVRIPTRPCRNCNARATTREIRKIRRARNTGFGERFR